ncbi:hypothetical protein AVEN_141407-1 [Araneus ventricosus]|uniref:Uncharacterized protein n=1 Tax=Araneus ventricosus TaxID=182803 RepID=A0A4Y2CYD9_ARAVE|nr:hypothetical protein AVEN_141407-1 [Araneus ventricosus]
MCGPSLTPGNHYFQTQSATGSGERAGHEMSPRSETRRFGSISFSNSIDIPAVWAVAPSYWNYNPQSMVPSMHFGPLPFDRLDLTFDADLKLFWKDHKPNFIYLSGCVFELQISRVRGYVGSS